MRHQLILVSPERPDCDAVYSDGWYRRSVPTVDSPTLTTHIRRMVSQNVPSGSNLHPAKCSLHTDHGVARASQLCHDHTFEELTVNVRRWSCPSSSEVQTGNVRERVVCSPSSSEVPSTAEDEAVGLGGGEPVSPPPVGRTNLTFNRDNQMHQTHPSCGLCKKKK